MLSKLFRRKKPFTELQTPTATLRLLGAPVGNGLLLLERELSNILAAEGNTTKAYLRRVQYSGEDRVRLALIIAGTEKAESMATVIAKACQPLAAIDILFFDSLSTVLIQEVQSGSPPFYVAVGA